MSFQRSIELAILLGEVPYFLHSASAIIAARFRESAAIRDFGTNLSEAELNSLQKEYFPAVREELKQIKEHASYLLAELNKLQEPELLKRGKADTITCLQEIYEQADSLASFPDIAVKPDSPDKAPEPTA